jgi:hypothetical protein
MQTSTMYGADKQISSHSWVVVLMTLMSVVSVGAIPVLFSSPIYYLFL